MSPSGGDAAGSRVGQKIGCKSSLAGGVPEPGNLTIASS